MQIFNNKMRTPIMIGVFLVVIFLILAAGSCSKFRTIERIEETRELMGTYVSITVFSDEETGNKAIDSAFDRMEEIIDMGVQVVILGTGEKKIEKQLRQLARKFKGEVVCEIRYDEKLAHLIYAGADGLLIPSKYEPCGLIQMIAMKYGTLPVAHAVGGLQDTIKDGETGFLYGDYKSRGLVGAVKRVESVFSDKGEKWEKMVARAMAGLAEDRHVPGPAAELHAFRLRDAGDHHAPDRGVLQLRLPERHGGRLLRFAARPLGGQRSDELSSLPVAVGT